MFVKAVCWRQINAECSPVYASNPALTAAVKSLPKRATGKMGIIGAVEFLPERHEPGAMLVRRWPLAAASCPAFPDALSTTACALGCSLLQMPFVSARLAGMECILHTRSRTCKTRHRAYILDWPHA